MYFDYFYGEQAEQYSFYRIPKVLITDDAFEKLSTDAKVLYSLFLDRVSLSFNSGWVDEYGRVYIIYTIRSIQRDLHCAVKKAVKLVKELEQFGLIEKVNRGQGKPALIYVKNFYGVLSKGEVLTCQKHNSGVVKSTTLELSKGKPINTKINNTDINYTDPILSETDVDKDEDRDAYYRYFYDRLEMDIMRERYPYDKEVLDALLDMVLDVVCSKRKTIRIAGDDKAVNVVKAQFMKLQAGHVEYVLDGLKNSASKVRNIKQYILAALYNAPLTMQSYYQAWVNHDMATGKLYGGTDERD